MLAPWKKSCNKPRERIKSRDITLPTKFHLVKAMVFPVVTRGCEKVKEESENVGVKLNIQETKIMASGPITSWQIDGETMKTETDIFLRGAPKSLLMVTTDMK